MRVLVRRGGGVRARGTAAGKGRLKDVGEDRLQSSEEGTEEGKEKSPRRKVIVTERSKRKGELKEYTETIKGTYAKPTPAMTGNSDTSFFPV